MHNKCFGFILFSAFREVRGDLQLIKVNHMPKSEPNQKEKNIYDQLEKSGLLRCW